MSEAPVTKAKWTFQDFQIVSPFLAYLCIFTWDAFVGPTPEFYKGIAFILLCINGVSSRTFGEVILLIVVTIDIFDLAVPKHCLF